MAKKRKGRGKLSTIQQLPPEAQPAVEWAAKELADDDRTQKDILAEFNQRLHDIDPAIEPISKSAFNRHSMRLSLMTHRMAQTREIATAVSQHLGAKTSDDLTIMAAEAIKTLIFELLGDAGEDGIAPLEAVRLATALKQASQAQLISTDRRTKLDSEFHDAASKAVEAVGRKKGISRETVEDIKSSFLGIKVTK